MNLTSRVYIIYYPLNSVHSRGLPVLPSGIVHTDNLYLVSFLHIVSC